MKWEQVMEDRAGHLRIWIFTLRETGSHWGVLSSRVTWLTWLTFNKITLPFCQHWLKGGSEEEGRTAGKLPQEAGRMIEMMAPMRWAEQRQGCEMREWGDRFRVYFEGGANRIWKDWTVVWEKERSWEWLQGFWPFGRKECASSEMKVPGGACFREKLRGSVLGRLGLRCWMQISNISLEMGERSGLEVYIWKWHLIRFFIACGSIGKYGCYFKNTKLYGNKNWSVPFTLLLQAHHSPQ